MRVVCEAGKLPQRLRAILRVRTGSGGLRAAAVHRAARRGAGAEGVPRHDDARPRRRRTSACRSAASSRSSTLSNLATRFKWERPGGPPTAYQLGWEPSVGELGAKERRAVTVTFAANSAGVVDEAIACRVFGMTVPLGFALRSTAARGARGRREDPPGAMTFDQLSKTIEHDRFPPLPAPLAPPDLRRSCRARCRRPPRRRCPSCSSATRSRSSPAEPRGRRAQPLGGDGALPQRRRTLTDADRKLARAARGGGGSAGFGGGGGGPSLATAGGRNLPRRRRRRRVGIACWRRGVGLRRLRRRRRRRARHGGSKPASRQRAGAAARRRRAGAARRSTASRERRASHARGAPLPPASCDGCSTTRTR